MTRSINGADTIPDLLSSHTAQLADNANKITTLNSYKDEDRYRSYIYPRHKYIGSKILNTVLKGMAAGDSICQGTGASDYNHNWQWLLSTKLQSYSGNGTSSDWSIQNNGVGSTTIEQVLAYLAHTLDSTGSTITKGQAYNFNFWVLMTGVNDSSLLNVDTFSKLYQTAVRLGIRAGIDVFCCTEQPYVDMTTGVINDTTYQPYADAIRRIALQEGASLVDIHKEWYYQQAIGTDLRTLTIDGTHPTDAGHAIIADFVYRSMTMPSNPTFKKPNLREDTRLGYYAISQYNMGTTSGNPTLYTPSLTTQSSSRGRATGTADAIHIPSGGYVVFNLPNVRIEYIILTMIQTANSGSAIIESPWGLPLSSGRYTQTTAQANNGQYTREMSFVLKGGNGGNISNLTARIVASGGDIYITGVHAICPIQSAKHDTVRGTESGTWSDVTDIGLTWRSSATVGNTITVNWYGTDLSVDFEKGVSMGMVSYSTDGGTTTTTDGYLNAGNKSVPLVVATNLTQGWHSTVFTVVAKNASSSANTVNIRNLQVFCPVPIDGSIVAYGGTGITINALEGVNHARTQSGIPTISGNTVTVSTSGIVETAMR